MHDAMKDAVWRFLLEDSEDRCPECSSDEIDVERVKDAHGRDQIAWAWCQACGFTVETDFASCVPFPAHPAVD